jgi:hypothetical protein
MKRLLRYTRNSLLGAAMLCGATFLMGGITPFLFVGQYAYAQAVRLIGPTIVGKVRAANGNSATGSIPTVSGGTLIGGSTDFAGGVVATNSGAVTLSFASAFTNVPLSAVCSDNTNVEGLKCAVSATTLIITGQSTLGDTISYVVIANAGG